VGVGRSVCAREGRRREASKQHRQKGNRTRAHLLSWPLRCVDARGEAKEGKGVCLEGRVSNQCLISPEERQARAATTLSCNRHNGQHTKLPVTTSFIHTHALTIALRLYRGAACVQWPGLWHSFQHSSGSPSQKQASPRHPNSPPTRSSPPCTHTTSRPGPP